MRATSTDSYIWTIREIHDEAPDVRSFILETDNERPVFNAGQYLTVRLPGFEPAEGKSYSISSGEYEPYLRLTIKKIGIFSSALFAKNVEDTLTTSTPYGYFYPEIEYARDITLIAGGIGITPFMSILKKLHHIGYKNSVSLVYTNRTVPDIVFHDELDALAEEFKNLTITYHITREEPQESVYKQGRPSSASILETVKEPENTDFFICGSIDFTKGIWKELRDTGIEHAQLYTEGFF